ncbi:MAG TPA: VIT family protein [Candidatus Saccharimonadales bacterium]|nr:VIT family protein [Candidatus Saccharimonadales bacterium]
MINNLDKIKSLRKHNHTEPHVSNNNSKLNWLRASVLGANDGIVSIAGLVVGVAGATSSTKIIFTAGLAGIIAGAISMAAGEYVSVSSSRDTEKALLKKERFELKNYPEAELEELACIYEEKGLSPETALIVAKELTKKDPEAAHFDAELNIDPNNLTDPWHAAFASAGAFTLGSIIPISAVLLSPVNIRIPFTFFSVLIALGLTGTLSAKIGGAEIKRAVFRVVTGGALAMAITYGVGRLFNVSGI